MSDNENSHVNFVFDDDDIQRMEDALPGWLNKKGEKRRDVEKSLAQSALERLGRENDQLVLGFIQKVSTHVSGSSSIGREL